MLIQRIDILCNIILRVPEEEVRYIVDHIRDFYGEFRRFKRDKQGNRRRNKPKYVAMNGEYWSRVINPPKQELKVIQKRINAYLVENVPFPEFAFGGIKGGTIFRMPVLIKGKSMCFRPI